ncbi:MAG: hypothetical protein FWH52_06665 [Synergistaceae bacterium]|nr:hypothetical protein [Synergistaceae bacterium]
MSEQFTFRTAVEAVAFMKKIIDDYWNQLISEEDYCKTMQGLFTIPEKRKFFLRRNNITPSAARLGKYRLEELMRVLKLLNIIE